MRFAVGMLASAVVLFASAAIGLVGTWALVSGTGGTVLGALFVVIAQEDRQIQTMRRLPVRRITR